MDIPYRKFPPIFLDRFVYRGSEALPGSATLPEHWSLISGTATTNSGEWLEFNEPGYIEYSGEDIKYLDDYVLEELTDGTTYANFSVSTELLSDSGLDFSLRSRIDNSNYISFRIDISNNRVRLEESDSYYYDWVPHLFNLDSYYIISLWCFRDNYYAYVNGKLVTSVTANLGTSFRDETGFGLQVNSFSSFAYFYNFKVHRLNGFPGKSLEGDPSNLYVEFRKRIQSELSDVNYNDWETFKWAHKLWSKQKDTGYSNRNWWDFGYPVREPMTEDWFKE